MGKYLGLPEHFGRKKKDIFAGILDRIQQRAISWSNRFLSSAGKQVLLKAVLTALPSYAMSCFKLPISLCKKIQSALTRFWWDDKPGVKKICWVSWDKLTLPTSAGGLGFREIEKFNHALLAKLAWRLIDEPDSMLARMYKGKYFPHTSFLDCHETASSSHGWTGLLAGRAVLKQGIGWLIGDGTNIKVWEDHWLSTTEPKRPIGPLPLDALELKVADLMEPGSTIWNIQAIRHYLPQYEDSITSLQLSSFPSKDSIAWLPFRSGVYTTKSGYSISKVNVASDLIEDFDWKACVWRVKTAPKIKSFLWKLKSKALAVGHNLVTRGIVDIPKCKHCGSLEDELHILLYCPLAAQIWDIAPVTHPLNPLVSWSMNQIFTESGKQVNLPPMGLMDTPLFPWLFWNMWKARNQLLFENRHSSPREIVLRAIREAKNWQEAQGCNIKTSRAVRKSPSVLISQAPLCFTDASWLSQRVGCGLGWVIKDHSSKILAQDSVSKPNVASVLLAEALALKAALIAAKNMGIRELNCLSDSLLLITLINSEAVTNETKPILHDIRCLRKDFNSILFNFIPRSENVEVDALAKLSRVSVYP